MSNHSNHSKKTTFVFRNRKNWECWSLKFCRLLENWRSLQFFFVSLVWRDMYIDQIISQRRGNSTMPDATTHSTTIRPHWTKEKDSRQGSSMHVHAVSTTTVLLDGGKYVHVKNWSINVGLQNRASHQDWIVNLQIWQWKIRPKNPKRHFRHAKTYRILLSKGKEIIVSRVEISFGRCRG